MGRHEKPENDGQLPQPVPVPAPDTEGGGRGGRHERDDEEK
ncbi:hypothetical protein ACFPZ0_17770 [Streptomonospora nanhaiensis]|uniref:Uncharacterized protein n=1 Tax=Streptomonospora nanhaiensis TaxID=1323731 RepID=A0A853BST7_9ACTN|nr:hypothetical protein [Streptomonospora nanhaiensis]NYI97607.1 hypothetical protein [Streptomonospora nanhaiensis]